MGACLNARSIEVAVTVEGRSIQPLPGAGQRREQRPPPESRRRPRHCHGRATSASACRRGSAFSQDSRAARRLLATSVAGTARRRSRETTTSWPSGVPSRRVASFMAGDHSGGAVRHASISVDSNASTRSDASVQGGRLKSRLVRHGDGEGAGESKIRRSVDLSGERRALGSADAGSAHRVPEAPRDRAATSSSCCPGVAPEDFLDGEAAAAEWVKLTTHNGTHLDAPWHFHSTMNKGERSITIDEVPLEWCFQPG